MTDLARTNTYNTWIDETGVTLPTRTDPTQRLRDWVDLFREVVKAAEFLSKTPFVPKEMLGKPADVAAAIMKGHELGMDPLDALANVYVIHGRVGFYAEFQRRRIIQAGHTFRVVESSDTRCIVEGQRKEGGEPQRASFSADQARKAGLDLGKYPADKLVARATSRLCRQVFPDVLSGTLIAEDIIDGLIPADDDQPPQAEATPRPALQRSRPARKPKAAASQPPTAISQLDDDIDELLDDESTENVSAGPGNRSRADNPCNPDEGPPPALTTDRADEVAELIDEGDVLADDQSQALNVDGIHMPVHNQPEPITGPQLRKLSALLREAGFDDRDSRHGFVTAAIGRHIDSAKDLTKDEASQCINILVEEAE